LVWAVWLTVPAAFLKASASEVESSYSEPNPLDGLVGALIAGMG